jgi:hypothetical protein
MQRKEERSITMQNTRYLLRDKISISGMIHFARWCNKVVMYIWRVRILGLNISYSIFKLSVIGILISSVNCNSAIKENAFNAVISESIEMEGNISILAIDEMDRITGQMRGQFITYLQTKTGERFILEPYHDVCFVLLQPNLKVKVFGIMKDKRILYKRIVPIKE